MRPHARQWHVPVRDYMAHDCMTDECSAPTMPFVTSGLGVAGC
jgi:hypothetical protein